MWRSFLLGVVTGLRSQLPAALLAWRTTRGQLPEPPEGPAALLRRPTSVPVTAVAAIGELIGDKLPMTPSRLDPGPFGGRLVLGATAGAGIASAFGRSWVLGALLGGAGAAVGALVGYRARAEVVERTSASDTAVALAEDGLAISLGLAATRRSA